MCNSFMRININARHETTKFKPTNKQNKNAPFTFKSKRALSWQAKYVAEIVSGVCHPHTHIENRFWSDNKIRAGWGKHSARTLL